MSDDFKLDWHKIERAAGFALFETGRGKMRFNNERKEWIDTLAASLSKWWRIGADCRVPKWSEIRDQEKEIEQLARKLLSALKKRHPHNNKKTLIDELTRLHADTVAASSYAADKAGPDKGELWRDEKNLLVHEFMKQWRLSGGTIDHAKTNEGWFMALVEIMRQCAPNPEEYQDTAGAKAIRAAIKANSEIKHEAQIDPLYTVDANRKHKPFSVMTDD